MNELDFRGRTAVITGGAAGIGFAVAQRLAASGATVAVWDRDEAALAAAPARTRGYAVDVATFSRSLESRRRRCAIWRGPCSRLLGRHHRSKHTGVGISGRSLA
jgi:3-oxoacyl-[acyl-carrier protein] reductase